MYWKTEEYRVIKDKLRDSVCPICGGFVSHEEEGIYMCLDECGFYGRAYHAYKLLYDEGV